MSATSRLMAFVKDQPLKWLPATAFEQFARQSWRTRISDARKKFEAVHDGTIENRVRKVPARTGGYFILSEYRWVPQRAATPAEAHNLNEPAAGRLL